MILESIARGFQAETGEEWEECALLPGAFRDELLETGGSHRALTDVGVDGSVIMDVLFRLAFDVMVRRPKGRTFIWLMLESFGGTGVCVGVGGQGLDMLVVFTACLL